MKLLGVSGVLLFLLLSQSGWGQTSSDEKLVLEHADRLSNSFEKGQIIRKLQGLVRFRQGTATLSCDEAIQLTRQAKTIFKGNVHIVDGRKNLRADQITYFENYRLYEAVDSVVFNNGPTTLFADRLKYFKDDRKLIAQRNVQLDNRAERLRLTANHAEYFRDKEYIRVTENPILVQFDSTGREEMRILGDLMESFDRGKRVKVTGHVQIFHGETRARCEVAEYFADKDKIVLSQKPVAWQMRNELRGKTIELYMKDRKIREVHVLDHATAVSPGDSLLPLQSPNKLSGQKIIFYLTDGQVEKIIVDGTATSIYNMVENGQFKGLNWVQGDRITLFVTNNFVHRVLIESDPGKSTGKFLPPGFKLTEEEISQKRSAAKGTEN